MHLPQPAPDAPPIDAFADLMDGLRQVVAAEGRLANLALPLIALILTRLRRLGERFTRIIAAGPTIQAEPAPNPQRPKPQAPKPEAPKPQPGRTLPRTTGWLLWLLPVVDVKIVRIDLMCVLSGDRMADLIETHPDLRRVLRPLCAMLGIPLPIALQRPRRPRPPRPKPPKRPRTPRWKDPYYPRERTADGILPRPIPVGPGSRFWPTGPSQKTL